MSNLRGRQENNPMLHVVERTDQISPADNSGAVLTVMRWAQANLVAPCAECGGTGRVRDADSPTQIRELCDMLGLDIGAARAAM